MGCCFSSPTAAAASTALHAAADYINPPAGGPAAPAASPATAPPGVKQVITSAHVFRMPDGDTFTCRHLTPTGLETTSRVRVMAIDCPETRQNYGREAGDLGRSLLNNRRVTLHVRDVDRYGRLVADVLMPDGRSFAEVMLAAGAAWHYKAYDKRDHLAQLENHARQQKKGLWQFARPQPPWDYRKRIRDNAK